MSGGGSTDRMGPREVEAAVPADERGSDPVLEVSRLRVWFDTDEGIVRAVDGVDFEVREGETLGLVGESGCGKTVTALSIVGLLPMPPARLEAGSSIRFRGEELAGAGPNRLRSLRGSEIAMVFQEPMTSLNPVYSVGEQIGEGLRHHRGLDRRAARAEAVSLLSEVGIADPESRVDDYPHQLSGGMRQRVMIAMALSCEPDLLVADEPTTALDVTVQAQILDLLLEVRARRRMSVLLITHDLGVVAEVCDRVVVMYAGQVVESGSVGDVFREPAHPYTRALLDSLPTVDDAERRLVSIPGTVPSPLEWPAGCRFRPRCLRAAEGCEKEQPVVTLGSPGRTSRCWRAGG